MGWTGALVIHHFPTLSPCHLRKLLTTECNRLAVLHKCPVSKRFLESFIAEGFRPRATMRTPWTSEDAARLEDGIRELRESPTMIAECQSIFKYLSQVTMGSTRNPKQVCARVKWLYQVSHGEASNQESTGEAEAEEEDVDDATVIHCSPTHAR
jgi:hypothetical protein